MCVFSIIIVVFNSVNTIENAIESFINQNFSSKELIIIDGGSKDGTVDVIKKHAEYIAYWVSEPDCGIYDAMNKGIAHATGQYIAFLGADDYFIENSLENVSEIVKKNSSNRLFCFNVYWALEDEIISVPVQAGFYDPEQLRYNVNVFPHQAVFAKRELFAEYGLFNTEYKILSDYEWLLRIYNLGEKFYSENIQVVVFGKSGISSVQRKNALLECGKIMCKAAKGIYKLPYQYTASQISHRFFASLLDYLNTEEEMKFTQRVIRSFEKKNIIIFGSGNNGVSCFKWLEKCAIAVTEFWDNGVLQKKEVLGKPVRKPRLASNADDIIIITCYEAFFEVHNQLESLGYQFEKDFIGAGALVLGCGE